MGGGIGTLGCGKDVASTRARIPASTTTNFEATLDTTGVAHVAFFAEHVPTEFEFDTHYFMSTDLATDIEPAATLGAAVAHDHGRRLSGDNECAVDATKDNDGDGIVDLAAEGECCVSVYGSKFDNEYGCGTTLAEVQAGGCCPEDFLLRYSLQPGGEDQTRWDCVSFVDKAGCTAMGPPYQWTADVAGLGCPHTAAAAEALGSDSALGSGPLLATAILAAAAL